MVYNAPCNPAWGKHRAESEVHMTEYHKIQTVFKRDPATNSRYLLMGEWSLPEFEYLCLNQWVFTEKVDGTNIRVCYSPDYDGPIHPVPAQVTYLGRSDTSQIPKPLLTFLETKFPLELLVRVFGNTQAVLFGEGYGPGIQKVGALYANGPRFALFDVRVGKWWLERHNVEDVADKLNCTVVPIVGEGTLMSLVAKVKAGSLSTMSSEPKLWAEGIVARPKVELFTRAGERIITKLKLKDFPSNDS